MGPSRCLDRHRYVRIGTAPAVLEITDVARVAIARRFPPVGRCPAGDMPRAVFREEFRWVGAGDDTVVVERPDGKVSWWMFAGSATNLWLSVLVDDLRDRSSQTDPLEIRLVLDATAEQVRTRLAEARIEDLALPERVLEGAIENLKFHEALPDELAREVVTRRLDPGEVLTETLNREVRGYQQSAT